METSTQRQLDVQVGDHQVAANLAVPGEATGAVVVAGGPDQDARLGRVAHDLREARLATLLLHVEPASSDEDSEAPTPERTAWEQARVAAAVERLRLEPATADLPVGLFLQGAAAEGGLRAAAGLPVDALVCYNGRFAPDGRDKESVPGAPSLLLLDGEAAPQLGDENEEARRAMG